MEEKKDKENKEEEKNIMRVHQNFYNRIINFIDKFEEKHGIKISTYQATKILDDKIERQGGLRV